MPRQVNARDDDDFIDSPTEPLPRPTHPIPNSPPPSFRSRASSRERNQLVNPDLADAFDDDSDESDDEGDDRQRLVRGTGGATPNDAASFLSSQTQGTTTRTTSTPATATGSVPTSGRVYGGGIQSDGVFSNLTAKPELGGEEKEELPPSYEEAAADPLPQYWETTLSVPGLGMPDDVYIDGMPVGSLISFGWNALISTTFQLVGFLFTYLLHSTHASKNGSRFGLGITLIHYGFYMNSESDVGPSSDGTMGTSVGGDGFTRPQDPNSHDYNPDNNQPDNNSGGMTGFDSGDWLSYILMIVGWFILIRAVGDYLKAMRHKQLVLQSPDRGLGIPIIAVGESSERVV
ncbi:hypothetical protein B0T18DRAFT_333963 [Schizothecium vesticola]|uniref:Metal homeostatis protein bsd2 n=1 Tax=Schizothecium vesticola TaxID=314040 RepID=A0AA40BPX4_9PEZI|nr:hypothetical protein B0T18DRAFT_333963 [Schizothecium vesticola]